MGNVESYSVVCGTTVYKGNLKNYRHSKRGFYSPCQAGMKISAGQASVPEKSTDYLGRAQAGGLSSLVDGIAQVVALPVVDATNCVVSHSIVLFPPCSDGANGVLGEFSGNSRNSREILDIFFMYYSRAIRSICICFIKSF